MKSKRYSEDELARMGVSQRARHVARMQAEDEAAQADQAQPAPPAVAAPRPTANPIKARRPRAPRATSSGPSQS